MAASLKSDHALLDRARKDLSIGSAVAAASRWPPEHDRDARNSRWYSVGTLRRSLAVTDGQPRSLAGYNGCPSHISQAQA